MHLHDNPQDPSPYRQLIGIAHELPLEGVLCVLSYAKQIQMDMLSSHVEQKESREQQETSLPILEITEEEEREVAQALEEIQRGEYVKVKMSEHTNLREVLPSGFEEM